MRRTAARTAALPLGPHACVRAALTHSARQGDRQHGRTRRRIWPFLCHWLRAALPRGATLLAVAAVWVADEGKPLHPGRVQGEPAVQEPHADDLNHGRQAPRLMTGRERKLEEGVWEREGELPPEAASSEANMVQHALSCALERRRRLAPRATPALHTWLVA
eukprot:5355107-Prymnesium_polylepis.1